MIRKREDYRLHEFTRRQRLKVADFEVWVVSKEDLILSKLHWARESGSERQLADVENLIATGCDVDYLKAWSAALNLTDTLHGFCRERHHAGDQRHDLRRDDAQNAGRAPVDGI
jgi:hypothetical protein